MTPTEFAIEPEAQAIFDLIQMGDYAQARQRVDAYITRAPEDALALYLRGLLHKAEGDLNSAMIYLNKAMKAKPDFKRAVTDLAYVLQEVGQVNLAIKIYEHSIRLDQGGAEPKAPPALTEAAHKAMKEWTEQAQDFYKRGRPDKAAEVFRKALGLHPDDPDMLVNLSVALWAMGRHDESEEALLRCLRIRPNHTPALNQLGNSYKDRRYLSKAVAAYRLAHAADPRYRQPLANMGKVYFEMQMYAESIDAYERTLKLEPDYLEIVAEVTYLRQMICRWEHLPEFRARIVALIGKGEQAAEPFLAMAYTSASLQLANARRWSHKMYPGPIAWKNSALPAVRRGDGKLRIGYLSSDFQRHATLALISEMFAHHDRTRFEIYAYSYGVDDRGPERMRVRGLVDHFRDLYNVNDEIACDRIRQDGIDILVDLKGFTQNHRLSLMARRPAPVQMHYLGFPGTTGSPFIDYFIGDAIAAPESLDPCFTEAMIRLPGSYQINDRTRMVPAEGPSRAEYGLPEKGFVYCGFNNLYKITPELFAVWMRLLKGVEGSVLWLLETHEESTRNLRNEAKKAGVDPARIVPAKLTSQGEHLKRYRHADLLIDTTPVCGHTTTSDALWCGVPVVTMLGESFIGRVAASLLHAVGLPELVTHTLEEYEALALDIAKDPARLKRLRRHLEEGRMRFSLFDSTATTRALEAAYIHAAELQKKGEKPRSFALAPDLSPR